MSAADVHQTGPSYGQLLELADSVRLELENDLMPFWLRYAVDTRHGGFIGHMSNDLKVDQDAAKGLVLNARYLWAFSSLYRATRDHSWLDLARLAFEYLERHFWDIRHGGYFWQVDADGHCIDDLKKIYGQAFAIYALAQFHHCTGEPAPLERALMLFELVERKAHDQVDEGYMEICTRDWTIAHGVRLSHKDMPEPKSMNTHLHLLEAFTCLYMAYKDGLVLQRLKELIDILLFRIWDRDTGHLGHFFSSCWQRRSSSYTFGHEIEASWLLWEAAQAIGDPSINDRLRPMVLGLADVVLSEGLGQGIGGLCYEGRAGKIVDYGRQWWPQAEAVVGFLNAYAISGRLCFLDAAVDIWRFIDRYLVDRRYGEWFWEVDADGRPNQGMPKVSAWKGPYHTVRCCLEVLRRVGREVNRV